jgi:hypothetical protein
MAGDFASAGEFNRKTAWLPYQPSRDAPWLSGDAVSEPYFASSTLQLVGEATAESPFQASETYGLEHLPSRGLAGDFGSFWYSEFEARLEDSVIEVGPVPATDPALPVALSVRITERRVTEVEATMESGAVYRFVPVSDN